MFTNEKKASKSGTKFHDLDADGARDGGEPGLAGWTFYVDYDGDSTLDAGEPSAASGADGTFTINAVTPGTWAVREVGQVDWFCSTPAACTYTPAFVSGGTTSNLVFGNYQRASVSGMKFHDLDADGTHDAGETGLSGWTFYVDYDGDSTLDAGEPNATSGVDGTYTIT